MSEPPQVQLTPPAQLACMCVCSTHHHVAGLRDATPHPLWERDAGKRHCALSLAGIRRAAALSQVIIAGASLAGVAVLLLRRHPTQPDRPLIAFELALMFLPLVLLGVSAGRTPLLQSAVSRIARTAVQALRSGGMLC